MSELWIVIPPPRREPEVTLTIAFAVAITLHVFPLIAADPEEPAVDIEPWPCCFCVRGHELDDGLYEPLLVDNPSPALARQQAIEQARIGGLGSFAIEDDHDPTESCAIHDFGSRFHPLTAPAELPPWTLDNGEVVWRVKEHPQLAEEMRAVLPAITIGEVYTSGPIDKRSVRRSLMRAFGELARCDQTKASLQLGDDRVDDGAFSGTFLIDREGRVAQVVTDETSPTSACVARALRGIAFPATGELTQVHAAVRYGTTERSAGVLVR